MACCKDLGKKHFRIYPFCTCVFGHFLYPHGVKSWKACCLWLRLKTMGRDCYIAKSSTEGEITIREGYSVCPGTHQHISHDTNKKHSSFAMDVIHGFLFIGSRQLPISAILNAMDPGQRHLLTLSLPSDDISLDEYLLQDPGDVGYACVFHYMAFLVVQSASNLVASLPKFTLFPASRTPSGPFLSPLALCTYFSSLWFVAQLAFSACPMFLLFLFFLPLI